jgi:hypothetical protein
MRLRVKLLTGLQTIEGEIGECTGLGGAGKGLSESLDRPPKAVGVDRFALKGSAGQELQQAIGETQEGLGVVTRRRRCLHEVQLVRCVPHDGVRRNSPSDVNRPDGVWLERGPGAALERCG